jgi:hypothetical protein
LHGRSFPLPFLELAISTTLIFLLRLLQLIKQQRLLPS